MRGNYNYIYDCPNGCKNEGKPIAATIKGWKRHMTRIHGGYSQDELAVITDSAPKSSESGRAEFLSEADNLYNGPLFAQEGAPTRELTPEEVDAQKKEQAAKTAEIKTEAVSKKFSSKLNKMKRSIAEKFPMALSEAIKDRGAEWQLSPEDIEMFTESIENCFEVLDVDFRITPISTVLSNPLWVLVMPILALILIFVPKAVRHSQIVAEENRAKEEENVQPTVN